MKYEKKRIEVVTTDGIETRRLIWVERCEDGSFYWGICIPKGEFHSSYHASGKMHFSKHHEAQTWEKMAGFKLNFSHLCCPRCVAHRIRSSTLIVPSLLRSPSFRKREDV